MRTGRERIEEGNKKGSGVTGSVRKKLRWYNVKNMNDHNSLIVA